MKKSNRVEEFRVGNYVESAKSGSLGKVVSTCGGLGENGVVIEIGDIITGYTSFVKDEDIRPIPLTEGLLEDALSDVFQKAECDYKPTEYEIPRCLLYTSGLLSLCRAINNHRCRGIRCHRRGCSPRLRRRRHKLHLISRARICPSSFGNEEA